MEETDSGRIILTKEEYDALHKPLHDVCDALGVERDPVKAIHEAARIRRLFDIYHRGYAWIEAQLFKADEKEKAVKA